jgi:hypothetical protein
MFTAIVVGVLSVSALGMQTDTIVDAGGAQRLSLESFRGEVVVRTWDRDAIQVKADHPSSRFIDIRRRGSTIDIEAESERGMGLAGSVDFELTVPVGMDLEIEGMAIEVDIQGTEGEVEVGTIHGSIHVVGGRGSIYLGTVNGDVTLEGARGDIEVTGVAGSATIRDSEGDIVVDAVGGSVTLQDIRSHDVEAGTVGGSLRFEGEIFDDGIYTFGTHGGPIWLYLPTDMNASVDAITLAGNIEIDFPGAPSEPSRASGIPGLREQEVSFEVGNGGGRVEVESFGGQIHILRAGSGGDF